VQVIGVGIALLINDVAVGITGWGVDGIGQPGLLPVSKGDKLTIAGIDGNYPSSNDADAHLSMLRFFPIKKHGITGNDSSMGCSYNCFPDFSRKTVIAEPSKGSVIVSGYYISEPGWISYSRFTGDNSYSACLIADDLSGTNVQPIAGCGGQEYDKDIQLFPVPSGKYISFVQWGASKKPSESWNLPCLKFDSTWKDFCYFYPCIGGMMQNNSPEIIGGVFRRY
jgi:hypothetical protein